MDLSSQGLYFAVMQQFDRGLIFFSGQRQHRQDMLIDAVVFGTNFQPW